jgi:hypothetical protein
MILKELIEQYPDINNATFSSDDISIFTLSYDYVGAFERKFSEDWKLKVKKIHLSSLKCKDLEWINELFPNIQQLQINSAPKIKSINGLQNLVFLEKLYIQKLQSWTKLSELKSIQNLKTLILEQVGKDAIFNVIDFPKTLTNLEIIIKEELSQLLDENLDFSIFNNLTNLSIQSNSMGNGRSLALPNSLIELFIHEANSLTDLNFLNNLNNDCKIVLRGSNFSKLEVPTKFSNLKVIPHN